MPTVLSVSGFRFFFYSLEGAEPSHIHVERDQAPPSSGSIRFSSPGRADFDPMS